MIARIGENVHKIALLGAQPLVMDRHYHCHCLLNNIKVIIIVITTVPHNNISIQHRHRCHWSGGSKSRFTEPHGDGPRQR